MIMVLVVCVLVINVDNIRSDPRSRKGLTYDRMIDR